MRNLYMNKLLWYIAVLSSLLIALLTLFNLGIYSKVVHIEVMPGIVSQDLITAIASVLILVILVRKKETSYKSQIIILAYMLYLFYAYGVYVIERFYNMFYFAYMFILTISFYSIIFSLVSIDKEMIKRLNVSHFIRKVSAIFLIIIPVMFYALWIGKLIPLTSSGTKVEFFYSVYILDLCFIMPFFIIIAVMSLKNKNLGTLLTPCGLLFGSVLLLSVGIGELLKPYFQAKFDLGGVCFYLVLGAVFGTLAIVELLNLESKS